MINSVSFDFSQITSEAVITAIVGYLIVFFSLVLLFLLFNNLPRLIKMDLRSRMKKRGKSSGNAQEDSHFDTPGEVNAAIATAIYLYFNEIHDEESNIITMQKISKRYSPWSSKIYGLRNNPGKF